MERNRIYCICGAGKCDLLLGTGVECLVARGGLVRVIRGGFLCKFCGSAPPIAAFFGVKARCVFTR